MKCKQGCQFKTTNDKCEPICCKTGYKLLNSIKVKFDCPLKNKPQRKKSSH